MMKIEDLKPGDVFYDIHSTIYTIRYEYLCEYPHNEDYFIILNRVSEEPERIYKTYLQRILDKNLLTREDAEKERTSLLEAYLEEKRLKYKT